MKTAKFLFATTLFALFTSLNAHSSEVVFPKRKITIGGKTLLVEVATTVAEQQRGLMHRKSLAEGTGMIFVYKQQRTLSFWMKNTFVPLSIGFFDKNRVLYQILDMEPSKSLMQAKHQTYHSKKPGLFALEVPRGWFQKAGIKPGLKFEWAK